VVQAALEALRPDEILRVGGAGHKVKNQQALQYVFYVIIWLRCNSY
jgi:hypothetical protein